MRSAPGAADIIRLLDLRPHPEGGHFRETFRDKRAASGGRAATNAGPLTRTTLGPDLEAGERPQAVVPAHAWQAAESLGDWTLAGCTVAPGFEFSGFEMAAKDWSPG
jgi:hypothetical protein